MDGPTARGMRANDWCILRTSPGRTLGLAKSLAGAGLEVWTPATTYTKRKPGSKAKVEMETAIMPTFVFARAQLLPELMRIRVLPISPHPPFSIFRYLGDIPLIADRAIEHLRSVEENGQRARLKKVHRYVFPIGQEVHLTAGAFVGLDGEVKGGDGRFAMVCFGGSVMFKIATFLLRSDDMDGSTLREAL